MLSQSLTETEGITVSAKKARRLILAILIAVGLVIISFVTAGDGGGDRGFRQFMGTPSPVLTN